MEREAELQAEAAEATGKAAEEAVAAMPDGPEKEAARNALVEKRKEANEKAMAEQGKAARAAEKAGLEREKEAAAAEMAAVKEEKAAMEAMPEGAEKEAAKAALVKKERKAEEALERLQRGWKLQHHLEEAVRYAHLRAQFCAIPRNPAQSEF